MNWKIRLFRYAASILIAVIPAVLTYCQARMEIREKTEQNHEHARVGYESLVKSVGELQATVNAQHDSIIQLQADLSTMETLLPALSGRVRSAHQTPQRPNLTPLTEKYDSLR